MPHPCRVVPMDQSEAQVMRTVNGGISQDLHHDAACPPSWFDKVAAELGGRGVRIAVIDSGWDRTIPRAGVLPGISLVGDRPYQVMKNEDDHDRNGHGTECTSIILRLAPRAFVLPVRIFDRDLDASPEQLIAAIDWAIDANVDIINLSLTTGRPEVVASLYRVCAKAAGRAATVVSAGGNDGITNIPAAFDTVVGVAARRFGSPFALIYRPDDALECVANGRPWPWTGRGAVSTSRAAATVTGLLALLLAPTPDRGLPFSRGLLHSLSSPH